LYECAFVPTISEGDFRMESSRLERLFVTCFLMAFCAPTHGTALPKDHVRYVAISPQIRA